MPRSASVLIFHAGQRAVFNRILPDVWPPDATLELTQPEQALRVQGLMPRPDFVVAENRKPRTGPHRVQTACSTTKAISGKPRPAINPAPPFFPLFTLVGNPRPDAISVSKCGWQLCSSGLNSRARNDKRSVAPGRDVLRFV